MIVIHVSKSNKDVFVLRKNLSYGKLRVKYTEPQTGNRMNSQFILKLVPNIQISKAHLQTWLNGWCSW